MFKLLFSLSLLTLLKFLAPLQVEALQTVDEVDLKRYMGKWYEIARLQDPWQRQCAHNTQAFYSLNNDGTFSIKNQCQTGSNLTDLQVSQGVAQILDSQTHAKFKVIFPFFKTYSWEFSGDYWIILLDKDYQYAAVSEPTEKHLWILSRTPTLPDDLYVNILSQVALKMAKLNVLNVLKTKQDSPNFN